MLDVPFDLSSSIIYYITMHLTEHTSHYALAAHKFASAVVESKINSLFPLNVFTITLAPNASFCMIASPAKRVLSCVWNDIKKLRDVPNKF